MKRIGIAASKIAKGNLALYNFYVVLISLLFSLFIFIIVGATVTFALVIISYVETEIMASGLAKDWSFIFAVCMVSLTVIVTLLTLFAISQNIRLFKGKSSDGGDI